LHFVAILRLLLSLSLFLRQMVVKLNKMVYSVLTQQQYISFLATCFGFYKTIFRPLLTTGRYIQCVHTVWDPILCT
jgi:hypothetical protein